MLLSYDNVFLMSELCKIAFCADAVDEWNCNYLSPAHNSYSSSSNYSGQHMHIYQASMCMTLSRKFSLTHNEQNWGIRLRIVLRLSRCLRIFFTSPHIIKASKAAVQQNFSSPHWKSARSEKETEKFESHVDERKRAFPSSVFRSRGLNEGAQRERRK